MTTIDATPESLARLRIAYRKARRELSKMHSVNAAFKAGMPVFIQRGYSEADFRKFAATIERNPEYGTVPFSPALIANKFAEMERLGKAVRISENLLHDMAV